MTLTRLSYYFKFLNTRIKFIYDKNFTNSK